MRLPAINDRTYAVAPSTLDCLRQQGTSPIFSRGFLPGRAKIHEKRKKKYRFAEGQGVASEITA
jgi:hypothetical protein